MGSSFSLSSIRPKLKVKEEKKKTRKPRRPSSSHILVKPSSEVVKSSQSSQSLVQGKQGKTARIAVKPKAPRAPKAPRKPKAVRGLRSTRRDASITSATPSRTQSVIEIKRPKGGTRRDRRKDDTENTKAEKPKKKPKTLRQTRHRQNEEQKSDKTQEDEETKNTSAYMRVIPPEKTSREVTSLSCPIMETACEEHAFITEVANKPPPNLDNFFQMADPFANENDMLDVSDTIFDVANEFPNMYLRGNLTAPDESEFRKKPSGGARTAVPAHSIIKEQPTPVSAYVKKTKGGARTARARRHT